MVSKNFLIKNDTGLHARPASELCALSKEFESDIKIRSGNKIINPRSMISLLTGEMSKGKTITVEIEGLDEEMALCKLTEFFDELDD